MIICLPFCAKDGGLALLNLQWIRELDPKLPYHCLLSHDNETPATIVRDMTIVAKDIFKEVTVAWYQAPDKNHWPAAANWAFQSAARYIAHFFPTESWLFLEADATPIRSGWLQDLEAEHIKGGKPFTGHIVSGMGHPNGVASYPPMVAMYSQDAMRVEETAWDVVLGATLDPGMVHNAGVGVIGDKPAIHLIQHCWNMDETTRVCTNGHGVSPTFRSVDEAVRNVDLSACIYHRCKDGSLIHWLREFYKAPHKAMVPDHTSNEQPTGHTVEEVLPPGDVVASPPNSNENTNTDTTGTTNRDVENASSEGTVQSKGNDGVPFPRTEIFIVTFGLPTKRPSNLVVSDFDWLAWCLRSIRRHCTGFTGITLAIPDRDAALLKPLANEHAQSNTGIPLRIRMFSERPGKGHITHMAVMGSADDFVPKDTEFVLHVDADVIFKESVTPAEYIHQGKPVYVWRSYDSLAETRNGQKVVSDCAQWKAPTEAQLNLQVVAYTMCRHPTCFPIGFYPRYRHHIEGVHGKPYFDYMISGRSSFPPDRMDFTAMGAFAFNAMHDQFDWVDVSGGNHLAPRDKQQCYWSHGGVTPTIQKEIEGFLK